jgi:DNA-binding PadR family transcriptional regulator
MNDLILLSLLIEGPKHGYRLKKEAAMLTMQQRLHNNTVYPLLNRFLKEGLITQRESDGERGQTRLLYELTSAGRQYLTERLAEFTESDAASESAFRLRVGLFDLLDVATRRRILELRDKLLTETLERTSLIGQSYTMSGWPARTFNFAVSGVERERAWIAELAAEIDPKP